ncbi:hypothetical protein D3Y57_19310 [Sphingomonas paeninsulae]|uniref:Uncharacterized protein n=1 Tax=Sphingomonas paeninsulae TaxID=2319844 RepID=A0A494TJW2_SPHPE|nr:hypothetical protein [Sphingomonas paeninsulae]AYJ87682.1 hypothetical protein D3Y57_19310 [Sphingomonas paeninsulae]
MKINLQTVLGALPSLVPLLNGSSAVVDLVSEIVKSFDVKDQAVIQESIAVLAGDNDAGHARLQAKLLAASGK